MENRVSVKTLRLSERLRALAGMVTPGNVVADVGCDHGFLSVYLLEQGIAPRVIASDVRRGPLAAAQAHVEERGLAQYIETRLTDGLTGYRPGEAQTMVCAGMGGRLMQNILLRNMDVALSFEELILQPQSELRQFRIFLREQGFETKDENILCEDGKYYFLFKAAPAQGTAADGAKRQETDVPARLGDKYGAGLLRARHPALRAYLEKCLAECQSVRRELLKRMETGSSARLEQGLAENGREAEDLRAALSMYTAIGEGKGNYDHSDG